MSTHYNETGGRMKELADELMGMATIGTIYGVTDSLLDTESELTSLQDKETTVSFNVSPTLATAKRTVTEAEIKKFLSWLPQVELFDSRISY